MHDTVSQIRDVIRGTAKRALAFLGQHKLLILGVIALLTILFIFWKVPEWRLANEVVLVLGILLLLLWEAPKRQLASWKASLEPRDLIELENDARRTWAQILGGLVILIGLYFTWQTVVISQEGQITERFTRAIDQLGSEKLEIRLGGIYALERIARDSERDHWPIMEILTAYVRENAPWNEDKPTTRLPADIQAVLTVLGRRTRTYGRGEDQRLDLRKTDIQGVSLRGANLQEALLEGANLEGATIWETDLQGAFLKGANLQKADLRGVNLQWANLRGVNLQWANLWEVNLQRADLGGANLQGADLSGANLQGAVLLNAKLQGASLFGADLQGAYLEQANLEGANLWKADLRGAYLKDILGLTQDQIDSAITNENTVLPHYLRAP